MRKVFTHMLIPGGSVGFPPWIGGMFLFKSLLVRTRQRAVSGTVKDENGQPFLGSGVIVKSTSHGIPVNADGKHSSYNQI